MDRQDVIDAISVAEFPEEVFNKCFEEVSLNNDVKADKMKILKQMKLNAQGKGK